MVGAEAESCMPPALNREQSGKPGWLWGHRSADIFVLKQQWQLKLGRFPCVPKSRPSSCSGKQPS